MTRREFMATTSATALSATAHALAAPPEGAGRPVNLLLIMTDQQRWDAMSCAGNPILRTPNLDRLASEGVRFELCNSHCPVCAPDRSSLLTGRNIEDTLVRTNSMAKRLQPDRGMGKLQTFDEILNRAGYACEFHGKFHVPVFKAACYRNAGDVPNFHDRFVAYLEREHARREPGAGELTDRFYRSAYRPDPLDWRVVRGFKHGDALVEDDGQPHQASQPDNHGQLLMSAEHSVTAFQAREAIDAIRRAAASGRPFSLTCSFHYPHAPMLPTEPYYSLYPPERMPPPPSLSDPMTNNPYRAANKRLKLPEYRDPQKIRFMISNYYGLVHELDEWTGKILQALEETGQASNTLVVFTSDHGEMLGDHGMREKNIFLEGSVRVPLILRLPGVIPAGKVVPDPVSHLDLFATILDYCGQPVPPSHGRSLRGVIDGVESQEWIVSEWNYAEDGSRDNIPNFMVRTRKWKFIYCRNNEHQIIDCLFDMENDRHELHNLIGRNPDKEEHRATAERMKAHLMEYLERVRHPFRDEAARKPVLV